MKKREEEEETCKQGVSVFCAPQETLLGSNSKKDGISRARGRSRGGDVPVLLEEPEGLRLHGSPRLDRITALKRIP